MTVEEKRDLLQQALKECEQQEYVAWINWQVAVARVERLVKGLSNLEGS